MLTIDHEDDTTRVDLQHRWDDPTPPQPQLQEDELICSTESVCNQLLPLPSFPPHTHTHKAPRACMCKCNMEPEYSTA